MSSAAGRYIPRRPWEGLLLVGCLAWACGQPSNSTSEQPDAWVVILGQRVAVELAVTPEQQAQGLGQRDELGWNRGMLFLYDEPGFLRFWMKGMRFDIDMVWIRDGRIIDISHRVPHVVGENGPIVGPRELADSVLEVPAGYAQSHGWRIGNPVEIERVKR